jgi:RHS repeat-associated protein
VIDLVSGELLEHSTYYPNGARKTYRAMPTPLVAREPMGFTTKEAEEVVGVTYFGERYLIPRLGRWACPDPLAIHALRGGEAMNSYHYVSGSPLQARDPLGLNDEPIGPNAKDVYGVLNSEKSHHDPNHREYPDYRFVETQWVQLIDPKTGKPGGAAFRHKYAFIDIPILTSVYRSLGLTMDPETKEGLGIVLSVAGAAIGGAVAGYNAATSVLSNAYRAPFMIRVYVIPASVAEPPQHRGDAIAERT